MSVLIRLNFIWHILLFTWTVMSEQVIIYYFCFLSFWLAHQQSVTIHSSSIACIKEQLPPPLVCKLPRLGKSNILSSETACPRLDENSLCCYKPPNDWEHLKTTFKPCTVSREREDKPATFRFIQLWLLEGTHWRLGYAVDMEGPANYANSFLLYAHNCRTHGALCLCVFPLEKAAL